MILTPLQKLPNNIGNLGKIIFTKGFKSCPKCKKSPNLLTLLTILSNSYILNLCKLPKPLDTTMTI